MELPLEDALELLDPIMELQDEVDQVNDKEFAEKLELMEKCKDRLRWDENQGCLRYPEVTSSQELLFQERSELVKTLPRFWSTALSADGGLLRYMKEEEQEIILKYLKAVNVTYHGGAKSGYTIDLHIDENPHFKNLTLSKTFKFTRKGISSGRGTEIMWTTDKDIEVFAEKGGTQSHTDMPSFFKWYAEDSENFRDLVAEEIVLVFWPNAHIYYQMGRSKGTQKGRQMLTEKGRLGKKVKGKAKILEDAALSKLKIITDKFRMAKEQATKERHSRAIEYELELVEGEREVHKECERLRRQIYDRRSQIIKSIPHFWLIAFLSHYGLHHLLSVEDQKIFRFLNSVNVEETEDNEGVTSGYTITLNFDENPYFKNGSLEKTISYTVMQTDSLKEYTDCEVNIRVSDIHWEDGMDITTGKKLELSDTGTSFFTWFCNLRCAPVKANDEVAYLVRHDFWPDAGRYFVNGNLDDEKKVDFVGINRTAQFTSSLRAFFI